MKTLLILSIALCSSALAAQPMYEDTVAVITATKIFTYHCTDTHVTETAGGYGLVQTNCDQYPDTRPTPPLPNPTHVTYGFGVEAVLSNGDMLIKSNCFVRQRVTDEEVDRITLDCRPHFSSNRNLQ